MQYQEADVHGVSDVIQLPDDPDDGQIFKSPNNEYLGGSIVISIFRGKELLGSATSLESVPTMSRKYQLTRMSSSRLLKKGDIINVKIIHNNYNELIFKDGYGWLGHKSKDNAEVLQEDNFRIEAFLTVGPVSASSYLYEYVCVEKIKEKP